MTSSKPCTYDLEGKRIYVAGHRGMVGSAICRRLMTENCDILTATRETLDLRRQADVEVWMDAAKPDVVILSAATVGGILANDTRPADFIYENLVIETNVIHSAYEAKVEKLLFLGSSCIYPRLAEQPIVENSLLTGPLETTNEWYAIAKIAGIKLCQAYRRQYGSDFISAMPTNLYGINDNFDPETSHVVAALIAKAHAAKTDGAGILEVWGTGKPRREFLFVDDAADALVFLLKGYSSEEIVNVGTGQDIAIEQFAELICGVVGFDGQIQYDLTKPDGAPEKRLDVSRLRNLGWTAKTELRQGLALTYEWYCGSKTTQ